MALLVYFRISLAPWLGDLGMVTHFVVIGLLACDSKLFTEELTLLGLLLEDLRDDTRKVLQKLGRHVDAVKSNENQEHEG